MRRRSPPTPPCTMVRPPMRREENPRSHRTSGEESLIAVAGVAWLLAGLSRGGPGARAWPRLGGGGLPASSFAALPRAALSLIFCASTMKRRTKNG